MTIFQRSNTANLKKGQWYIQYDKSEKKKVWIIVGCPKCGGKFAVFRGILKSDELTEFSITEGGLVYPILVCPNEKCLYTEFGMLQSWPHGRVGRILQKDQRK